MAEAKHIELPNGTILDLAGSGGINLVAGNYEYSEEEKVIGKWIDGKPVYKKVCKLPENTTINSNTWTYIGQLPNDMETIINTIGINKDGTQWPLGGDTKKEIIHFYSIDDKITKPCLITHLPKKAVNCCPKFERSN